MDRRGIAGKQLAADIGISPTSVSKIVTGQSKPRQVTLSRIMKRLCIDPEEEQMVIRAFTGLLDAVPDEPEKPERPLPDDEVERVTRYLELKSMSVAFKKDVEAVLRKSNLQYQADFRVDPFICDFMVHLRGHKTAIDCKYNVNRDWDRTYTTVKLLRENLPCDEVVIAIPYENELARKARSEIESLRGRVLSLNNLIDLMRKPQK
jgi:transcriptional regulator with XRE-family HTH domain